MALEDAEVGKRYHVEWNDCCAQGEFDAALKTKNYVPDDPHDPDSEPFLDSLTFANGVTISGSGVELVELAGEAS